MTMISIVMGVYNAQDTLRAAINSIIAQTFTDWEMIIVDDGSTDNTYKILDEFSNNHSKILIVKNSKNMGLPYCLNKGIGMSKGEFIARMDADDISYPDRLKTQLSYMKENEHVDVLGCSAKMLNHDLSIVKMVNMPRYHDDCLRYIAKSTPFIHPSVLIRKRFFNKNGLYNSKLKKAQDYDLWARGIKSSCYENIPVVLLEYSLATKKTMSTIIREIVVRTKCAYKYHYLFRSLMFSSAMIFYYTKINLSYYLRKLYKVPLIGNSGEK